LALLPARDKMGATKTKIDIYLGGLGVRKEIKAGKPVVSPEAFVADEACVIGNVRIGAQTSVWHTAVVRGDVNAIVIGQATSIQDGAVLHPDSAHPLHVGSFVTVGHRAILHGCTVEDNVLIGMGAVVLDGAIVGEGSIVGAGAVVKERMVIPPRSLVVGLPAKIVRTLDDAAVAHLKQHALNYVRLWQENYR